MLQPPKRSLLLTSLISIPLILIALWQLPKLQVAPLQERMKSITNLEKLADLEKERIVAENNIRTSMIQGIAGLFVAITAYVGYLNYRALLDKNAADRFSKAVEQLGNDNIHVRLGGIYALEQIAKDSEEKYYWSVMETLAAYLRIKSPLTPKIGEDSVPRLTRQEVQAVITVLGRRKHPVEKRGIRPLDLSETNLQGLALLGDLGNSEKFYMSAINLSGINFTGANFQCASLFGVILERTFFMKADLRGAQFDSSSFQEANMKNANFKQAQLMRTDFREANLNGANLTKASLKAADLRGAFFNSADLQDVNFEGADLQKAKFCGGNPSNDAKNLEVDQIKKAKNWQEAELPKYWLEKLAVQTKEEGTGEQESEKSA